MKRTRPAPPQREAVANWPRIAATVRSDGTGTLTTNGTERPVAADDIERLRAGVIACVTSLAARLHRPVRLTVTEEPATWSLAVRPDGIVQLLASDGSLPPAENLHPHHGPCRSCGAEQPVTAPNCGACGAGDPHAVHRAPRAVATVVPR